MITAAYALLYAREVTEVEVDAGLEFLTAQRSALLESELADLVAEAAEGGQAGVSAAEGGTAADPRSRAERSASKEAWIQYARALFSAAEFRFVD